MTPAKEHCSFCPEEVLHEYNSDTPVPEVVQVFKDNVALVQVDDTELVIKQYPKDVCANRAHFITSLHTRVNTALGLSPAMVETPNHRYFIELGEHAYDVTEFVRNTPLTAENVPDVSQFLFSIGTFVGAMHREMSRVSTNGHPDRQARLKIQPPTGEHFKSLLSLYEEHAIDKEWKQIIVSKMALSAEYSAAVGLASKLPRKVIHGDVYYKNILFNENLEIIGLIDYERAGIFYRIYEVIRAFVQINTFFNGVTIEPDDITQFLKGYLLHNSLESIELHTMIDLYLYTQAADISFLDPSTILQNAVDAEYGKLRYNNLLLLHNNRDRIFTATSALADRIK